MSVEQLRSRAGSGVEGLRLGDQGLKGRDDGRSVMDVRIAKANLRTSRVAVFILHGNVYK